MCFQGFECKERLLRYISSSAFISEATTTNGRVLISFQLGAFVPGYPVHPVIVHYPHVHFDQSLYRQRISSLVLDCCSILIGYYNCTKISFLRGHHATCKSFRVQTGRERLFEAMTHCWLFRRPWGMYFSAKDKEEMMSMIYNWPGHLVICILGLGDLGVQGIGIPIGKLDMYVAAAGINQQRVKRYLGLRQPWLEGEEYLSVVDEFMEAIHAHWPKAIVQDFQMKWAFERLQRYQKRFCMFNDDMQGTAGVALAGLLGTVRALGRPLTDFVNQKIVVVGAGRGLVVFNMAAQSVSRMAGAEASPQFFLLIKIGLITMERKGADPAAAPFAKTPGEIKGLGLREAANLVEVVKRVKPHVLLGLSGVGGIFNEQRNGKAGHVNQANNMYLFPGIGMGALLSGAHLISNGMLQGVSECLASYITEEEIQSAILYPPMRRLYITAEVRAAVAEELAEGRCDMGPRELR
ncbi:unnamed protein product [Camellia sinensis]